MIYENIHLCVDDLSFKEGFSSSSTHLHTTIQEIQADYDSFIAICNQSLQTDILQTLERVNVILIDLVKKYSEIPLEEVYLHLINDKELFQIIEITHNFLLPISIQIVIQRDFQDYEYDMEIMPSIIVAETQINLLYQKILDRNTQTINSIEYEFEPVVLDYQDKIDQDNEKKKNLNKKGQKSSIKKQIFKSDLTKTNSPSSPNDIDLNWG